MLISARDDNRQEWQSRLPANEVKLMNAKGLGRGIKVREAEAGGLIINQSGQLLHIKVLDGHTIELLPTESEVQDGSM